MRTVSALTVSACAMALAACSQGAGGGALGPTTARPAPASSAAAPAPSAQANAIKTSGQIPPTDAASVAPAALTLAAVNGAQFTAASGPASDNAGDASASNTLGDGAAGPPDVAAEPTPVLIKAEVLLDRSNFAPGVIDGRMGENVHNALVAYDKAHGLPVSGELDAPTWQALTTADQAPVLQTYTITAADVAGPWTPDVGENFVKMADLKQLGYSSAQELLAARFHMDQDFLKALNPGADFGKAGTQITVVATGRDTLPEVASLDVNKATKSVTALDGAGKVLAVFPATVGSTERPSPKGTWKVKGVAQNPDYTYNPAKLTWGPKKAGKLHIAPGPHNPVGVVWIALTAPDYGIHGTPDAHLVGKTASHGCVRLTNWDAEELSKAVKPGVKVTFLTHAPRASG